MTFTGLLDVIGGVFAKGSRGLDLRSSGGEAGRAVVSGFGTNDDCRCRRDGAYQTAVLQVEQKFAAAGAQKGTGSQKLAEVMLWC